MEGMGVILTALLWTNWMERGWPLLSNLTVRSPRASELGTVTSPRDIMAWFSLMPRRAWCWSMADHMEAGQKL